ncbi:MAG TPA: hypothetical protein VFQ80_12365 [Thermomicrobiales bacterium]|nr:hypothetical protein [Thermomicrobiales bacterium]
MVVAMVASVIGGIVRSRQDGKTARRQDGKTTSWQVTGQGVEEASSR